MTTVFLIIAGIGLAVLAASLVFGELFDFGAVDIDGPFSTAAIAAFVGAFGLGGAAAAVLLPDLGGSTVLLAVAAGLLTAIPAAWLAIRLTRAAMHMPTDTTLTREHLLGASGVVVTPVPEQGYGEVRLRIAGQPVKFNARCENPLPTGAEVFVVGTPSETSVVVEPVTPILPDA